VLACIEFTTKANQIRWKESLEALLNAITKKVIVNRLVDMALMDFLKQTLMGTTVMMG
jgi:hypothetical protein